MKLNNQTCKNAKPKNKAYKLFDGGGLYLEVMPNGSKLWRLKYRYNNKEKRLSIGHYPLISLLDARHERDKAKRLLLKFIDPAGERRKKKREIILNANNTLKVVALQWYEYREKEWCERYAFRVKRIFELYIFPYIGNRPIADITTPELLNDCLLKIQGYGSYDSATRARYLCNQMFRFAIQRGYCQINPADNLQGALKTRPKIHFRTIDSSQLPDFISALERNEARLFERTRRAVWLSLYTFCRPVEIRTARWSNIDLEEKIWSIPAEQMKMRRDHIVPLSNQVVLILKQQWEETSRINTGWVFPSQPRPRNPMSDGTVNKAIKLLGFGDKMVSHGFRALARTSIREKLKYDSEVIEKQLAHKTSNPLGEAYDRTRFIDERIQMMQEWADYVDSLKP